MVQAMSREECNVKGRSGMAGVREDGDGRRRGAPGRAKLRVTERKRGNGSEVREVVKARATDDGNVDGTFTKRMSAD